MKSALPTVQTLADRELVAASEIHSQLAFTARALEGLSLTTKVRFETRHWCDLVLLGAHTGVPLNILLDARQVQSELSRRTQDVLGRFAER